MKRKILVLIFLLIIAISASAEQREFYDYNTGYGGVATAQIDEKGIIFSSFKESIAGFLVKMLPTVGAKNYFCEPFKAKLTKEEKWLIKQALNQYDYCNGEKYHVRIIPNGNPGVSIDFSIVITDSKKEEYQILDSFCWGFI